jgi:hypothetical protein
MHELWHTAGSAKDAGEKFEMLDSESAKTSKPYSYLNNLRLLKNWTILEKTDIYF